METKNIGSSKSFAYLLALSAILLACTAGFFSVTGLSKLFSGASTAVMIMAGSLEFSKLVAASFLYRYWKDIKTGMKIYMTTAVIVLIFITSAGVYGYLSSAYSKTSDNLQQVTGQIELITNKKDNLSNDIIRLQQNSKDKQERIKTLNNIRTSQETRLDSLSRRGWNTKSAEKSIKDADDDIRKLTKDIDEINNKIDVDNNQIQDFNTQILESQKNDSNSEAGPLKYIADLTGKSMNSVANFFMLLLVFVFDPLAVLLVISTNLVLSKHSNKNKEDEPIINVVEDSEKLKEDELIEENSIDNTYLPLVEDEKPIDLPEPQSEPIVTPDVAPQLLKNDIEVSPDNFKIYLDDKKTQIDKDSIEFTALLKALFKEGQIQTGGELPSYVDFIKMVDTKIYSNDTIKKFLTLLNYLSISRVSGEQKLALMNYNDAQKILNEYLSFEVK